MTVIAFDGVTLAADKMISNGQTQSKTTKIFKHEDELLGLTGDISVGMEVLAWYLAGHVVKDYPVSNRKLDEGCTLIVIKPGPLVLKYESSPHAFVIEGAFQAFGCGDLAALAAMEMGAKAPRAVEVACKLASHCGMGIDTLTL